MPLVLQGILSPIKAYSAVTTGLDPTQKGGRLDAEYPASLILDNLHNPDSKDGMLETELSPTRLLVTFRTDGISFTDAKDLVERVRQHNKAGPFSRNGFGTASRLQKASHQCAEVSSYSG
jgi:hypothetical protein